MRQLLTGLFLALLAGTAFAQIGDSRLPLDIEADHVDVYDAERRIVWRGNVNAVQGTSSIRARQIEVFYTGQGRGPGAAEGNGMAGWGDIDRIVATEDVFYITPTQRARGQRGVYTLADETIVLTGDVIITQGENVISAARFVTNLATGNSSWESGEGERVRAVLHTRSGEGGQAPQADPENPSNR
jgi:lipopolysaccharide export system protein LptA